MRRLIDLQYMPTVTGLTTVTYCNRSIYIATRRSSLLHGRLLSQDLIKFRTAICLTKSLVILQMRCHVKKYHQHSHMLKGKKKKKIPRDKYYLILYLFNGLNNLQCITKIFIKQIMTSSNRIICNIFIKIATNCDLNFN